MVDTRIPLAGRQTDVLANLSEQTRLKSVTESNLASAAQQRQLTGQTIQAQQRQLNAPELASIFMDVEAIPVLLDGGKSKEAGQVGILLSDRLRAAGLESSATQLDRVLGLAVEDPVAASAFIKENYLPALRTAMPEVMRQVSDAQGNPVFENLGTGEREQPQRIPRSEITTQGQIVEQGPTGPVATDIGGFRAAPPGQADAPSAVREFQFFQQLNKADQERFLTVKRANPTVDLGDVVARLSQVPGEDPIEVLEKELAPRDVPAAVSERETAQQTARLGAQRAFDAGAERGVANNIKASTDTMIAAIDNILEHPGLATATGLSGTIDPRVIIPGTQASDVRLLINQLKDRIFVESLNNIRAQSQTGGAVGQVSDREGGRLENMMGALARNLSDEEFLSQLKLIKQTAQNTAKLAEEAFESQFGDINLTGDTELDIILQQIDALN